MTNNLNSLYTVEILNSSGTLIADISDQFKSLSFTITRNRPEQITIYLDLNIFEEYARNIGTTGSALLSVGRNSIRIKRGLNYLCAGEIAQATATASEHNMSLEIRAEGWLSLFRKRMTASTVTYTATDAGAIAWALINTTQGLTNGSFGVTQGTIQTSVTRTRTYEYKNIEEAIIQLSEVLNGFDFEFTYDKIFNVYYPAQGRANTIELEYPRNIKSITLPVEATNMYNEIICRGQGNGTEQLVRTRDNTSAQTTYKLRQKMLDLPDVKETATLDQHGDELLRISCLPIIVPQVQLITGRRDALVIKRDYWVGDKFTVKVPLSNYFTLAADNVYRIESISVSVDENQVETISLNVANPVIRMPEVTPTAPGQTDTTVGNYNEGGGTESPVEEPPPAPVTLAPPPGMGLPPGLSSPSGSGPVSPI